LAALEQQLTGAPNVRFLRRVSDMRQIYRQTKLLLVPSVWEEGFGMVAVEAQSCRIPVVASVRGGLPESVGEGGLLVDDYLDADSWVDAIANVQNAGRYPAFATRAARHAAKRSRPPIPRAGSTKSARRVRPRSSFFRGVRALAGFSITPTGSRAMGQSPHA
jgi:glycosyltransferase involved in cell wall biosynthesis